MTQVGPTPPQARYIQAPPQPSADRPTFWTNVQLGVGALFGGLGALGLALGTGGFGLLLLGGALAVDAGLDKWTGRGLAGHFARLFGMESDRRSLFGHLDDAFSQPAPRRAGYQMRPPAYQ